MEDAANVWLQDFGRTWPIPFNSRAEGEARKAANLRVDFLEFRKNMKDRGVFSGLTSEVIDQLGMFANLGLDEMIFQHVVYDSDEIPEYLAAEISPQVAKL